MGVSRYGSFEVRLKRAAGDDQQSVLTQSFIEVTTTKNSQGQETSTYAARQLSIEKNKADSTANTTSPKTLIITADEGETKHLLPVELKQPILNQNGSTGSLAQTSSVRFCRWSNAFFAPEGGTLIPDFIATDPDRVVVRLPAALVDPAKPHVGVRVEGIEGVEGFTKDTGVMTMTPHGDMWESEPLIFVADPVDDQTYNGKAGMGQENDTTLNAGGPASSPFNDQTRLAGFGAKIIIKFTPKGMTEEQTVIVEAAKMMNPRRTVNVSLNTVRKNGQAFSTADQDKVRKHFAQAKLIYRQVGIDLVQQGGINNHVPPASIRNLIEDNGQIHGEWTANYTVGDISKSGKIINYLDDVAAGAAGAGVKPIFWFEGMAYVSSDDNGASGERTPSRNSALIVFDGELRRTRTFAHELGHCLGLDHSEVLIPRLLMYSPGDGEDAYPWNENYLDSKRFHSTDDEKLNFQQ